jgi:MSHA biogenesis protein MshO
MTRPRGFTLIELIVVMLLIGIVGAGATVFITGPVAGYVDTNRRAQVADTADVALRRVARDLRQALPNSIRVGGGNRYLEYIPTSGGARYQAAGSPPLAVPALPDFLDFITATGDASFDYTGDNLNGYTGFVVVYNTGQRSAVSCATAPGGADAYEACNRRAISAVTATNVSITSTLPFPFASPGNRFHIVPATGPVTLACETVGTVGGNGTGTLRIYSNYDTGTGDWGSAAPAAAPGPVPPVTSSLLAEGISACEFVSTPGVTATNGLVTLRIALTRQGETVTLHSQVHVDNVP